MIRILRIMSGLVMIRRVIFINDIMIYKEILMSNEVENI